MEIQVGELWKDIKGYEGKYQVSNLGNVKSLQYKRLGKERILIPYTSNRGYYTVALSMNSKKTVRTIHRLVAETFVENVEDLPMVNHIDGNKKNNRTDNLEWCTQKHNIEHAWESGLAKKDNTRAIYQFDLKMNFIKKYKSQTEANKETGVKQAEISKCCNSSRNKAGDYIWCYDDRILSELDKHQEAYKILVNLNSNLKSELETQINNTHILQSQLDIANAEKIMYKKIAEFLAGEVKRDVVYYNADGFDFCELSYEENYEKNGKCTKYSCGENCIQCIIDWAKKEVEKDGNK